jgi:hypothetical protein
VQRDLCLAATSKYRRNAPTIEPTEEEATIEMDDSSDLDRKVSAHTDKVVIGFGVEADTDECKSEDVNDAEDINEAIDADVVNNHFFYHCVEADTVTNDNDFSNDGRRTSRTVFCSSSTSKKKRRVIAIIEGWSCDKCTYQHNK